MHTTFHHSFILRIGKALSFIACIMLLLSPWLHAQALSLAGERMLVCTGSGFRYITVAIDEQTYEEPQKSDNTNTNCCIFDEILNSDVPESTNILGLLPIAVTSSNHISPSVFFKPYLSQAPPF